MPTENGRAAEEKTVEKSTESLNQGSCGFFEFKWDNALKPLADCSRSLCKTEISRDFFNKGDIFTENILLSSIIPQNKEIRKLTLECKRIK